VPLHNRQPRCLLRPAAVGLEVQGFRCGPDVGPRCGVELETLALQKIPSQPSLGLLRHWLSMTKFADSDGYLGLAVGMLLNHNC